MECSIRQIECAPAPRAQVDRAAWVMSEPDLLSESEHGGGNLPEWILDSTGLHADAVHLRRRLLAAGGRAGARGQRDERTRCHRQGAGRRRGRWLHPFSRRVSRPSSTTRCARTPPKRTCRRAALSSPPVTSISSSPSGAEPDGRGKGHVGPVVHDGNILEYEYGLKL